MAREWVIPLADLSEAAFAPYGRIVRLPDGAPVKVGPGWECWYGFQVLDCRWPVYMGGVLTRHRPVAVDAMERHTHTFELLYPHGQPLIQPLALPLDLDDPLARPDPRTTMAFLVPADVGIILHPGTWHSAAFPVGHDCTYGFLCLQPDFPYDPQWLPFPGGDIIRVAGR